ncbi:MAG: hypothetical protein ICV60_04885 [Pyrinomonadaceae bacterium]|nr:hypothetical protein [Pyrinomonadaceae bacterium]
MSVMKKLTCLLHKLAFTFLFSIALVSLCTSFRASAAADKMKPEDVVSKHLAAIGADEARTSLKTMIAIGTVDATFRGRGISKISGTSLIASDGDKNLISLIFNNPEYPFERIGFNGDRVTGAEIRPGARTPLVNFLLGYDTIIRQGLLGGTLSTAWPLLHLTEKNAKLEYGGLKKIENKQVHELRYLPRKGGDIKISLFFDAETFQHVRSEYRKTIAGQMGTSPDASSSAGAETRYKMVEEFGDFKQEGNLNLPHDYKLSLVIENPSNSMSFEWIMKFTRFTFGQAIAEKEFSLG